MSSPKKLLILIEWFTPGYRAGGPIQSCVNLCIALKETYDIYVFTTDTDHGETMPYKNVVTEKWITDPHTGVQVYYANKKLLSFSAIGKQISQVDPHFIYLNLLFS